MGSLDGYCLLGSVFLLLNHLLAVLDHYTLEALVNLLTSEVVDGSVSVLLGLYAGNAVCATCRELEAIATQLGVWA